MPNPIKFRAWDNVADEMLYCGEDIDVVFQLGSEEIECTDIRDVGPSGDGVNSMEHLIYMQFTGIYDKNGKEIYEGDIILFNNFGDTLDKVVYSPGCFHTLGGGYLLDEIREIEVIGNIYENPELLEENNESR